MICWNCQWDDLPAIEKEVPKFHDLKCAISFVEKQSQQLAQREAEVADAHEALRFLIDESERISYWADDDHKKPENWHLENTVWGRSILEAKEAGLKTKATAEAHDAKVWNEAIEECIEVVSDNILPGSVDDSIRYSKQAMEALLKPEMLVSIA